MSTLWDKFQTLIIGMPPKGIIFHENLCWTAPYSPARWDSLLFEKWYQGCWSNVIRNQTSLSRRDGICSVHLFYIYIYVWNLRWYYGFRLVIWTLNSRLSRVAEVELIPVQIKLRCMHSWKPYLTACRTWDILLTSLYQLGFDKMIPTSIYRILFIYRPIITLFSDNLNQDELSQIIHDLAVASRYVSDKTVLDFRLYA